MAYQMGATAVTLNDLQVIQGHCRCRCRCLDDVEGHSPVAGLLKCNPSNICATFYTISTDSVLTLTVCSASAELIV